MIVNATLFARALSAADPVALRYVRTLHPLVPQFEPTNTVVLPWGAVVPATSTDTTAALVPELIPDDGECSTQ